MKSSISESQAVMEVENMESFMAILTRQGRYLEAGEIGWQVLEKSRSSLGPDHPRTLSTMYYLAAILHGSRQFEDAERVLRQLLPLRKKSLGCDHPDTIAVLNSLSEILCNLKKYQESMRMLEENLGQCERAVTPKHELAIKTLKNMGQVYMMQGDSHLATSVLVRALEMSQNLFGAEHPTTSRIQSDLTNIRGPQDSLALRQALAAKHGLPIPGDPFAGVKSMNTSDFLRMYENFVGITSGGYEVTNMTTLRISEMTGRDPQPAIYIPSGFAEDFEESEEEGTDLAEPMNLVEEATMRLKINDTSISTTSPDSQAFYSLVERSVEAWKNLWKKKGISKQIKKYTQILRGLDSLDGFLQSNENQFWFFQRREIFLRQKFFQRWDPSRLDDYVLFPVESKFVNENDCLFVSHYWRGPGNPDPQGLDLQPLQQRLRKGFWGRVNYFWVDFTCLPQWVRNESEEKYFKRTLLSIPKLVRDCGFTWHYPDFQSRLWVLFEAAEFVRNRSRPIPLADLEHFMDHLREMKGYGVRYVVNRHGYRCTSKGDRELVIGWLELLLILERIVPSIRVRQAILDAVDSALVQSCSHEASGVVVDKRKGTVTLNDKTYEFSSVPFETTGSDSHIHIKVDTWIQDEIIKAVHRAERAPDNRGFEEIGREYDREGEYEIAEVLHRRALADKNETFTADVVVGLSFLARNLQNQGKYEEAEELLRRQVQLQEEEHGPGSNIATEGRNDLAAVLQKRKLLTYYQRWKIEPLNSILELDHPNIPRMGQNETITKERRNPKKTSEEKETLWALLEQRKEALGPYHFDTLETMINLARTLRIEGNLASAERMFWLALAISEEKWGPEHVKTLSVMSNLAVCVNAKEQKEIYRQQLERHLKSVNFDHPDIFTVKFNLFQMCDEGEEIRISKDGGVQLLRRRLR